MNTKTIVAVIVGAIASFLLGWVIWGMLLMDYFQSNTVKYEGMMYEEPKLWAIFIGNLAASALLGWVLEKTNTRGFAGGFMTGLIIFMLNSISIDMMFYAMMNWYSNTTVIIVDIIVNSLFGGAIGGVMGLMMARGAEK